MKIVSSIRLVGVFLSMSFGLPTNSHPQRKLLNNTISPLSHNDHPDIKGFSYSYGNVDAWKVIDDTTGYVYFHNDVYFMEISPVSKLFLIRVQADFTPSSQANKNGNKSYDSRFDLFSGYIHTNVYQKYDGNKRSSSIKIKKFWPKSDDDFTANITSSFGVTYNFSSNESYGLYA